MVFLVQNNAEPMKKRISDFLDKTNVVGVIASEKDARIALQDPTVADIFEWRVDCAPGSFMEANIRKLKKPIIVTVRDAKEGGKQPWTCAARADLYKRYASLATFFDIEASTAMKLSDVIAGDASRFGTGLIISHLQPRFQGPTVNPFHESGRRYLFRFPRRYPKVGGNAQ